MDFKRFLSLFFLGLFGTIGLFFLSYIPTEDAFQLIEENIKTTTVEIGDTIRDLQSITLNALPEKELRGVWLTNIDSRVLFSKENLNSSVNKLAELNFNTLYPTVWNRGYTLFPSSVAHAITGQPRRLYHDLTDPAYTDKLEAAQGDRNMLRELIEIAHPLNLKVMPWFEYGFKAIADTELVRFHPDWLTLKQDGSSIYDIVDGDNQLVWLNPFHPSVQRFILALIDEVVSQYDVDGIQLDDHFALPVEYGYDPYTVGLYSHEHNGQLPPEDCHNPDWVRWRADKLTAFMEKVVATIKTRRPAAKVSVAVNVYQYAYQTSVQDWHTWIKNGYVDELIIQLYRKDLDQFVQNLEEEINQLNRDSIPINIGILSGLRQQPIPIKSIRDQVQTVRNHKLGGVSFFFYDSLWQSDIETPEQRYEVVKQLFSKPASRYESAV